MIKIAVVDDEKTHAKLLEHYLKNWSTNRGVKCEIHDFPDAESFLFEWSDNQAWEVLFLDIQMSGLDGMQLARKIRRDNRKVVIVFTTGVTEFLQEGYEVEAYRYLTKPLDENKIYTCMDSILDKQMTEQKKQAFPIRAEEIINHEVGESIVTCINPEDIVYIEAFAHYIELHTSKTCYRIREGISKWKERLSDRQFLCCHRSYLINILYVSKIDKSEIILDNGIRLPLSRRNRTMVNDSFIRFYSKDGDI